MKKPSFRPRNRMKDVVDAREELTIPTYTLGRRPPGKHFRRNLVIIAAFALLLISIYLPPLFISEPSVDIYASVDLSAKADRTAMESAQIYLRNNPEADFDNDGLTNEAELNANTGVYIIDNDDDGVTDYAELYLTQTAPRIPDTSIQSFVINADAKTGNAVNTPFKMDDVVLWADDYASKARGSVLPLEDGSYIFYHFKGWVQFPVGKFAYMVQNGLQTALRTNENGYFYINTDAMVNVRVYEEQPAACHILNLLGARYTIPDNLLGKLLSFLLPSNGFGLITCRSALRNDLDDTWTESAIANPITKHSVDVLSEDRFSADQRDLKTLNSIFSQIDSGNNVILSLMSHSVGESLVEVYGYTNRNNLLVCDPLTGAELGIIRVSPYSTRLLDASGTIQEYQFYFWSGCGYSSSARHRIVVVDAFPAETD